MTTFIGSLDLIEQHFGELFGYKKNGELTEEEKVIAEKFETLRKDILNLGYEQLKKVNLELDLYNIKGPYYKYIVRFRDE